MPQTTSQEKGNALEEAVHMIETVILGANSTTKETTVTIEPKKVMVIEGVKHEIDIFITIDYGRGYNAIFIFECKNWKEAVGKNEIIVFSEKIKDVQAQKGYFIAKSFGEYAVAQSKQDKRVELLVASDALGSLPPVVANYHIVHTNVVNLNTSLGMIGDPQKLGTLTVTDESKVNFQNEEFFLKVFNERIHKAIIDEVMKHEPTATFVEGVVYFYDKTQTITFQPNELFIDSIECREIQVNIIWEARVFRPRIVSKFDIATRGRIITFESDPLPTGESIKTWFINID
jgi:hypothetical protein